MRIDFMTLFPDMMQAAFSESIIARGIEAGYIDIKYHQIRDYSANKQRKVDDYPYGGGPGLIMAYQPIVDTYRHILSELPAGAKPHCIYMSPQGKVLNQQIARRLSREEHLIILCGHYEGVDERVLEEIVDEEISIGDYVLTGGELPACVLADCVARMVPGVLACEESFHDESHWDGLLEYPQYTRPAEKELRAARKKIAELIGASENEVHFTSGGSESNNWALRGVLDAYPRLTGQIIISAGEHPSVLETAAYLERMGRKVVKCPLTSAGIPDMEILKELLKEDTALVSMLHVNSETGAVTPLEEMVRICRSVNPEIMIHTDCVQSFGKMPVQPEKLGVDMISVSAHKIHGPRGVGFLYVRKGLRIQPLIFGGGQEDGLRSGTENVPGICGFAKAAQHICSCMEENFNHVTELNRKMRAYIRENFTKAVIVSDETASPYVLNVAFPGLRAEVLLHSLETQEVYVSVGSACSSHKKNRSHVLTAMGYGNHIIDGAIRISFCPENTEREIDRACEALGECVRVLNKRKRH